YVAIWEGAYVDWIRERCAAVGRARIKGLGVARALIHPCDADTAGAVSRNRSLRRITGPGRDSLSAGERLSSIGRTREHDNARAGSRVLPGDVDRVAGVDCDFRIERSTRSPGNIKRLVEGQAQIG